MTYLFAKYEGQSQCIQKLVWKKIGSDQLLYLARIH